MKLKKAFYLLLLTLLAATSAMSQTAAAHSGFPALKFRALEGKHNRAFFVEYLQYASQPAFRIRAHHYHAWCNGYLYITPDRIAYDPQFTPFQKDGVMVSRPELVSFTPRFSGYDMALQGKIYKLAFLSDSDAPPQEAVVDERPALMKFIALAYSDFSAAQRLFFADITGVYVSRDASQPPLTFAAKPIIKILAPAGAVSNATVDAGSPSPWIIGASAAAAGIGKVLLNGVPATIIPLSKGIALFRSDRMPLQPGATEIVIDATALDGNENSIRFRVVKPEVRIVAPVPGSNTRDERVTVRGVVYGMHDLTRVNVAGRPLPLTKRDDGGFEFQVQNLSLTAGSNTITGFTTEADGQRSTFDFAIYRMPPVPALTLVAIEKALRNSVSPVRMETLVDEQGVDFELTPDAEKRLRAAGATQSLLDAIAEGYTPEHQ